MSLALQRRRSSGSSSSSGCDAYKSEFIAKHYGRRLGGRCAREEGGEAASTRGEAPQERANGVLLSAARKTSSPAAAKPAHRPTETPSSSSSSSISPSRSESVRREASPHRPHGAQPTTHGTQPTTQEAASQQTSPARRRRSSKPVRASLSEQLATIGADAAALTTSIRKAHGLKDLSTSGGALFTTPSRTFSVGRLSCKYPSPVTFYRDKCVYVFHHPFEPCDITMVMHYRDMRSAHLRVEAQRLSFKIDHQLLHYGKDYAHDDPRHFVIIDFSSHLHTMKVKEEVMPFIASASRG